MFTRRSKPIRITSVRISGIVLCISNNLPALHETREFVIVFTSAI
jgi:hypothetical protein